MVDSSPKSVTITAPTWLFFFESQGLKESVVLPESKLKILVAMDQLDTVWSTLWAWAPWGTKLVTTSAAATNLVREDRSIARCSLIHSVIGLQLPTPKAEAQSKRKPSWLMPLAKESQTIRILPFCPMLNQPGHPKRSTHTGATTHERFARLSTTLVAIDVPM